LEIGDTAGLETCATLQRIVDTAALEAEDESRGVGEGFYKERSFQWKD
jgi:hypothetical protein